MERKIEMSKPSIKIPNVNSISCLIDRLAIECARVSYFENAKRQEHAKPTPDNNLIAKYDNLSRESCELRSAIKNELDSLFQELIAAGNYFYHKEPRTFSSPKGLIDLIDERYSIIGKLAATNKLNEEIKKVFTRQDKTFRKLAE